MGVRDMQRTEHPTASYMLRLILFVFCFIAATLGIIFLSSRFVCPLRSLPSFDVYSSRAAHADHTENAFYIVLDAGHGGEDGGAVSDNGVAEKELNLDIAKKLYSFLKLSDYTPVLIREDDRLLYEPGQENRKKYYDLTNRVNIANRYTPAVFV